MTESGDTVQTECARKLCFAIEQTSTWEGKEFVGAIKCGQIARLSSQLWSVLLAYVVKRLDVAAKAGAGRC